MASWEQAQREELRLCMLKLLYEAGRPLRGKTVRSMADDFGHPTTWDGFIRAVKYLRSEHLIYCFPAGLNESQSDVAAAKFVDLLMSASFDSHEGSTFMLKIAPRGAKFIEGNATDVVGVAKP